MTRKRSTGSWLWPLALQDDPDMAPLLSKGVQHSATILYLSYRAPPHEAGPEKPFDFSRATFADRWKGRLVRYGGSDPRYR